MKRRAIRPSLVALIVSLLAGCTIDIPRSYYQDTTTQPTADTGAADTVVDTVGQVDAPSADTAPDTAAPTDTTVVSDAPPTDAPPGDAAVEDGAADIEFGDVQFPPTCDLDEDCVPTGPLKPCIVGRCIEGGCQPAAAPDGDTCDDPGLEPTACVLEQCQAAKCRLVELGEAAPCGVTDLCFEDRCNASGLCVAVAVAACDDENACTVDSCDPVTGCVNKPNVGASCDDGDLCSQDDRCDDGGHCVGAPTVCEGDLCNKGTCNPETGQCGTVPATGEPCDDGDMCTSFDKCTAAGKCAGSFKCPKPLNPCHKATCSVDGVCSLEPALGQACNDGNGCTVPDVCECPPGTGCTLVDITCVGRAVPIGRSCETDKDCTYKGAVCTKGVCTIECGTPVDCPQPPPNQGTVVCEPFGTPVVLNACGITSCSGKAGQCVDGACFLP